MHESPATAVPENSGQPSLRLVNPDTGEVVDHDDCPSCAELRDQLAGADKDVRAWRARYANLKREIEDELDREHELFPEAVALFRYWQERCNHPHTEFTADRMKTVLPRLKQHGAEKCRRAIRGAAYDPFVTTLKNGKRKRHDDWGLIFRSDDKMEDFCERAPEPGPPTFTQLSMIDAARTAADRLLERAELIRDTDSDPVTLAHLLLEVNRIIVDWQATPTRVKP